MTRTKLLVALLSACIALDCRQAISATVRTSARNGEMPKVTDTFHSESMPHGIARPSQRATMSAPLQGMLVKVHVQLGEQVKKGQILAVMDNQVALASVRAAEAAADRTALIDHSKHALDLARSLLARQTSLQESHAGAEFELEQARSQFKQAEATLASAVESQLQAKRNLELEQARLEIHNVRAPFDGQIVQIGATVGTTMSPADKLLTIICRESIKAELFLPLELFGKLHVGESYDLWGFAPVSHLIRARLVFASPIIDPASKTFRSVFLIDNAQRRLPAGFGVRYDSSHPNSRTEIRP